MSNFEKAARITAKLDAKPFKEQMTVEEYEYELNRWLNVKRIPDELLAKMKQADGGCNSDDDEVK